MSLKANCKKLYPILNHNESNFRLWLQMDKNWLKTLIHIQPKCHQNAAKIQPKFGENSVKIQSKCSPNVGKKQSKFSQNSISFGGLIDWKVFSLVKVTKKFWKLPRISTFSVHRTSINEAEMGLAIKMVKGVFKWTPRDNFMASFLHAGIFVRDKDKENSPWVKTTKHLLKISWPQVDRSQLFTLQKNQAAKSRTH